MINFVYTLMIPLLLNFRNKVNIILKKNVKVEYFILGILRKKVTQIALHF